MPHRPGEFPGVGILPARMIRRDQDLPVRQRRDRPMRESWPLLREEPLPPPSPTQERVMGDAAQDEYHPYPGQELHLCLEIRTTAGELDREGTVSGWCAAGRGGDPAITQSQAVVPMRGAGLGGEPEPVQRFAQPIAAGIAGEHATGAVRPVGGRRESHHQQPSPGIAPAGDGFAPVGLVGECPLPDPGHAPAMGAQPRAGFATGNATGQRGERRWGYRLAAQVPVKLYVMFASPMMQATCPATWSSLSSGTRPSYPQLGALKRMVRPAT